MSVSATTRPIRPGEVDGKDYFFRTEDEFQRMQRDGELVESAEFAGNHYGTPRAFVEREIAHGRVVILDIDVQGATQFRATMPGAVMLFLAPPSIATVEKRLRERGTESKEALKQRLARIPDELAHAKFYDYLVINDQLDTAIAAALEIVDSEWRRTSRMNLVGDWCPKEEPTTE
jgi:guanylate kinase